MLLFNSTRNPYKEYERVNNLMGKDMERRDSMNEKEKVSLGAGIVTCRK